MVTFEQAEKTWLIVKPQFAEKARCIFADSGVKITTEGILVQLSVPLSIAMSL